MKVTAILLFLLGAMTVALSQPVVISGDPSYNADSPYNRLYSTRTVITFKGKVTGLAIAPPMKNMTNAVTLVVKTKEGKTWTVDVGPEWYVNNQHTRMKLKDNIQVTGSRVEIDGHDVILAEQIVKNRNVLALRRPMGRPYWDAVYAEAPVDDGINHKTIVGTITGMDTFVDGTNGVTKRITVHTDNGDFIVALAPDWYMQRQALQLSLGTLVNVNAFAPAGAPTEPGGQGLVSPPVVFATALNSNNHWMVLRTTSGVPMWYPVGG